jgi:hypothetical protein
MNLKPNPQNRNALPALRKTRASTAGATSVYINFLLWFTSVIPLDADRGSRIFPGGPVGSGGFT